jgi:hypothetical protein
MSFLGQRRRILTAGGCCAVFLALSVSAQAAEWIRGHYGAYGRWIPGHWIGGPGPGPGPGEGPPPGDWHGRVWVPGFYGPYGHWHPGHWAR